MTSHRDLDQLYQLPLADFTKARDELAKQSVSDGAAIRRLQKPNVPAWAVNQLYWRERGAYDALIAAAERVRRAQVNALAGKGSDVTKAEADHVAARRAALDRIRAILKQAGEKATAATMRAIQETLDALPGAEPPWPADSPAEANGFRRTRLSAQGANSRATASCSPAVPCRREAGPRHGRGRRHGTTEGDRRGVQTGGTCSRTRSSTAETSGKRISRCSFALPKPSNTRPRRKSPRHVPTSRRWSETAIA